MDAFVSCLTGANLLKLHDPYQLLAPFGLGPTGTLLLIVNNGDHRDLAAGGLTLPHFPSGISISDLLHH